MEDAANENVIQNDGSMLFNGNPVIVLDTLPQILTLEDGTLLQIVGDGADMAYSENGDISGPLQAEGLFLDVANADENYLDENVAERENIILPAAVTVVDRPGEGLVVVARRKIAAYTSLGKVIAPKSSQHFIARNVFILKVVKPNGNTLSLDTSDKRLCNWLCLINTATSVNDQNCAVEQVNEDIHFVTVRDIESGEELKVWYSEEYAQTLSLSATPDHNVKSMRTVRGLYRTHRSFIEHLLYDDDEQEMPRCSICHQDSRNLVTHVCPGLNSGTCPHCAQLYPSLAHHVCSGLAAHHHDDTTRRIKRKPGPDPEWIPGKSNKPKVKRTYTPVKEKRKRGRPRKYPLPADSFVQTYQHTTQNTTPPTDDKGDQDCDIRVPNLVSKNDETRHETMEAETSDVVMFELIEGESNEPVNSDIVSGSSSAVVRRDDMATVDRQHAAEDVQRQHMNEIYVEIVRSDLGEDNVADTGNDAVDTGQCPVCTIRIEDTEEMLAHVEKHNTQSFCFSCITFFSDMTAFSSHTCQQTTKDASSMETNDDDVESAHSSEKAASIDDLRSCQICEETFTSDSELNEHLCVEHEDEFDDDGKSVTVKPSSEYSCGACGVDFRTLQVLLHHLVACNPSQSSAMSTYDCQSCPQVFASQKHLDLHQKSHERYYPCSDCRKQFATPETRSAHACGTPAPNGGLLVKDNRSFCCGECEKTFKTQLHLNLHLNKHSNHFTCDICGVAFRKLADLDSHNVICQAERDIQRNGSVTCPTCMLVFTISSQYQQHYLNHQAPYSCQYCQKPYHYLSAMEGHQKTCRMNENRQEETAQPVACHHCMKVFPSNSKLRRHMIFHQEPRFECLGCQRQFHRKDYYSNHVCQKPDGSLVRIGGPISSDQASKHICPICGNTFANVSNRNKHMLLHKEKQLSCELCGKRFHLPHSLRHHKRYVHSKKLEAQCPHCQKMLKNRESLKVHVRMMHKDPTTTWPCPVCDQEFNLRGNMLKHMLKHSEQKTFHCKLCPNSFRYPEAYSRHMTEHYDGKRHACPDCDRTFIKEHELNRHVTIFHSGQVYVCQFCNMETRFDSVLRRHLAKKHPNTVGKIDANYVKSMLRTPGKLRSADAEIDPRQQVGVVVEENPPDLTDGGIILSHSEESGSPTTRMIHTSPASKRLKIELDGHILSFDSLELDKLTDLGEEVE